MTTKNYPVSQFRTEIAALIAEIEACMPAEPTRRDREFNFQHDAFRERCQQAKTLAGRLGIAGRTEWSLRSGDAYRIEQSLQLSLAYFRGRQTPAIPL